MANGDEQEQRLARLREVTRDIAPPPGFEERIARAAAGRAPSWSFFVVTWSRAAVGAAVALALCAALVAFHAQQAFLEAAARDLPGVLGGLP